MAESLGENCVGIAGRNKSVAGRNKLSQNRICVELKLHRLLRAVMGPIAGRNGVLKNVVLCIIVSMLIGFEPNLF